MSSRDSMWRLLWSAAFMCLCTDHVSQRSSCRLIGRYVVERGLLGRAPVEARRGPGDFGAGGVLLERNLRGEVIGVAHVVKVKIWAVGVVCSGSNVVLLGTLGLEGASCCCGVARDCNEMLMRPCWIGVVA